MLFFKINLWICFLDFMLHSMIMMVMMMMIWWWWWWWWYDDDDDDDDDDERTFFWNVWPKKVLLVLFLIWTITGTSHHLDPLSANPTKWSNIFKQIVEQPTQPTNYLGVLNNFVGLALKVLRITPWRRLLL